MQSQSMQNRQQIEVLTKDDLVTLLNRLYVLVDRLGDRIELLEQQNDDLKNRLRDLQQR